MAWPYQFVDLTHEEKLIRRHLLDRYGSYAQLSAIVPVLAFQLYRLAVWVSSERKRAKPQEYSAVPSSPSLKKSRLSTSGTFATKLRQTRWWLETDMARGWGSRGQWIAGLTWTCWLLFLGTHRTLGDYMHVTKRFGIVAASQFPVHYMLAMKSPYSPMALAFRSSHEQLNPWHRISGRVIYGILLLHGAFYINYFIQMSNLLNRLTHHKNVILGVTALSMITILMTTALQTIRRYSYRIFFLFHLFIGVSILPVLFFHTSPIRLYIVESLALFILDIIARKLDTIQAFTKITKVSDTSLIRLTVPVPAAKMHRFKQAAGQHVYLNIPSESAKNPIHQALYNPFTIAEVSTAPNVLTLVLRVLNGPTTRALSTLTKLPKANPPINIEGPYGCSLRFPNLTTEFDRILLVAGGVGATFILPIYREIVESLEMEGSSTKKVEMIWSLKAQEEAAWAISPETGNVEGLEAGNGVKVYLTQDESRDEQSPEGEGVEMGRIGGGQFRGRPPLRSIVNEMFRHGDEERVAILVCGPNGMADELRDHAGHWVEKGRHVWFHNEGFGW